MTYEDNREKDRTETPDNVGEKDENRGEYRGDKRESNKEDSKEDNKEDNRGDKKESPEKFSFISETIKPKPITRRQLLTQCLRVALCGLLLGMFACVGFFALRPVAQRWFRGEPEPVKIPTDDEHNGDDDGQEDEEKETPEVVLDAHDYEQIMDSVHDIAKEAKKCTVAVSGASSEEDWNTTVTGIQNAATGIITADNGQELLILTDGSVCETCTEWTVTFVDGTKHKAALKRRDRNSGMAMLSVSRAELSEGTWNSVRVATLGNSNIVSQGDVLIALGSMYGYPGGLGYGVLSSEDYKESFFDGECRVLSTDMPVALGGTGVLFNMKGEVVGIVSPSIWKERNTGTLNAYAISDMKAIIELLANGQSVPYIGVRGVAVTGEMQEQNDMPAGVYVVDVNTDSPAMTAGIQSGDIIWQINGENVTGLVTYQKAMFTARTGEEIRVRAKRLGADGYVNVNFHLSLGSME